MLSPFSSCGLFVKRNGSAKRDNILFISWKVFGELVSVEGCRGWLINAYDLEYVLS